MNKWEQELGIKMPTCKMTGQCCKGASPSTPWHQLLARASEGDDFARNFFSQFIPYPTIQDAKKVVPGLVKRAIEFAQKGNKVQEEDLVFYYCRYLSQDNKCSIHEDKPELCRTYPDSPFLLFAPGCAFEPWSHACKEKYNAMQSELTQLTSHKQQLNDLKNLLDELENQKLFVPIEFDNMYSYSLKNDSVVSPLSLVMF